MEVASGLSKWSSISKYLLLIPSFSEVLRVKPWGTRGSNAVVLAFGESHNLHVGKCGALFTSPTCYTRRYPSLRERQTDRDQERDKLSSLLNSLYTCKETSPILFSHFSFLTEWARDNATNLELAQHPPERRRQRRRLFRSCWESLPQWLKGKETIVLQCHSPLYNITLILMRSGYMHALSHVSPSLLHRDCAVSALSSPC